LNAKADRGDFLGITRSINGGTNGLADRRRYLERARRVIKN
jgi:putative chitinase